eukprot:1105359-Rhodomonas_salina.2
MTAGTPEVHQGYVASSVHQICTDFSTNSNSIPAVHDTRVLCGSKFTGRTGQATALTTGYPGTMIFPLIILLVIHASGSQY